MLVTYQVVSACFLVEDLNFQLNLLVEEEVEDFTDDSVELFVISCEGMGCD